MEAHKRNLAPLTPSLYAGTTTEFATSQQEQIAHLSKLLASLERRMNGQQKRIAYQDGFIATLKKEGSEARKRLRFLENAAKLQVSEAR